MRHTHTHNTREDPGTKKKQCAVGAYVPTRHVSHRLEYNPKKKPHLQEEKDENKN